ncbi:peroxidasin homolog cardinal [Musca autumnalis]|uniref:peroxidasin homolog cardinal n=1 Tax=Musca autumnalis TaxID=221902 RepID=UPI003CF4703C
MADETTPLTTGVPPAPPGPVYVFPGGVSPRSRRQKMHQFQWCLGLSFLIILIAALVLVLVANDRYYSRPYVLLATNNTTTNHTHANTNATLQMLEAITSPIPDEPENPWALRKLHLNQSVSDWAIGEGIKALGDRELLEEGLEPTPVNSPAFRHYRSLSTNPQSRKLARRGFVENSATLSIARRFNYSKPEGRADIGRGPKIVLPDPTANIKCDFNAKYRRPSGICNNKNHPRHYGASLISYRRMVNPDYEDGIGLPRGVRRNGTTRLPPARDVSAKIYRSSYETDSNFTVMLAVFGQFLDHDITATSLTSSQEGESINCCTTAFNSTVHPECFPVTVLPDDIYYSKYNLTCMNFVRSAPSPTGHFGPRQQLNQATSFIDGSVVYGNSDLRQNNLRAMINGSLRMYVTSDGRELLPISTNLEDGCNRASKIRQGRYCFESGDDRANENLLLTSMHLLWARHHNYLAQGLQNENPDWDDETLFQESRRILAAQMAHITYNEFLPILLGKELAEKKGLLPQMENLDAPDTYDRSVNPSIANGFAAAAFRFAHTLLPGLFNVTKNYSDPESIELHKMLFNPFSLWSNGGIDRAMLVASNTPVQRVDRFFSTEMSQKLFEGTSEDTVPICGLDLVSLNIQRGRDHGLPSYPVYRKHCNLPPVDTWDQMADAVDSDSLASIRGIYASPHDVDVYTGALSEPPLDGAIFGPLLACMVSDQFLRLKRGDSFWYERKMGPQRFTKDQLRVIYNTTLSQIICRNSDDIEEIRKYVMEHRQDEPNALIPCRDLKDFDFTPWNENLQPAKYHSAQFSSPLTAVRVMTPVLNVTTLEANDTLTTEDIESP